MLVEHRRRRRPGRARRSACRRCSRRPGGARTSTAPERLRRRRPTARLRALPLAQVPDAGDPAVVGEAQVRGHARERSAVRADQAEPGALRREDPGRLSPEDARGAGDQDDAVGVGHGRPVVPRATDGDRADRTETPPHPPGPCRDRPVPGAGPRGTFAPGTRPDPPPTVRTTPQRPPPRPSGPAPNESNPSGWPSRSVRSRARPASDRRTTPDRGAGRRRCSRSGSVVGFAQPRSALAWDERQLQLGVREGPHRADQPQPRRGRPQGAQGRQHAHVGRPLAQQGHDRRATTSATTSRATARSSRSSTRRATATSSPARTSAGTPIRTTSPRPPSTRCSWTRPATGRTSWARPGTSSASVPTRVPAARRCGPSCSRTSAAAAARRSRRPSRRRSRPPSRSRQAGRQGDPATDRQADAQADAEADPQADPEADAVAHARPRRRSTTTAPSPTTASTATGLGPGGQDKGNGQGGDNGNGGSSGNGTPPGQAAGENGLRIVGLVDTGRACSRRSSAAWPAAFFGA